MMQRFAVFHRLGMLHTANLAMHESDQVRLQQDVDARTGEAHRQQCIVLQSAFRGRFRIQLSGREQRRHRFSVARAQQFRR